MTTTRMATADRAEILRVMRQEAAEQIGGLLAVATAAMVCRLADVHVIHAELDIRGWTVTAISYSTPDTVSHESTRPTLRQALACALLPHLEVHE